MQELKTIPFYGILTDHIAAFFVKELGGTGSQGHDKDCSVGVLSPIRIVLSMNPGSGSPMVSSRICFRIGPAGVGGPTPPAMIRMDCF